MAKVTIESNDLVVRIEGWHRLWAFKSRISVHLDQVRGARADPDIVHGWKGWRAPGTYLPGVIVAGTFYKRGERIFWDVRDPSRAVVIELEDEKYSRLVVEVDDPQETVEMINRRALPPSV